MNEFRFKLVKEIDPNWSDYDKRAAHTQQDAYMSSLIWVDNEYGDVIDDDYRLMELNYLYNHFSELTATIRTLKKLVSEKYTDVDITIINRFNKFLEDTKPLSIQLLENPDSSFTYNDVTELSMAILEMAEDQIQDIRDVFYNECPDDYTILLKSIRSAVLELEQYLINGG